jgi:Prolyl oligopeptidase family
MSPQGGIEILCAVPPDDIDDLVETVCHFPADVDDCSNAATHLAEQKLADPKKLCITGGSAGGYTTLACLAFKCVAEHMQLANTCRLLLVVLTGHCYSGCFPCIMPAVHTA